MRNKISTILWGVSIITLGVILLGNALDFWSVNLLFKGFWTLFLIIPSAIECIKSRFSLSAVLTLAFSVVLLLICRDIISYTQLFELLFPSALIITGVYLVANFFNKKFLSKFESKNPLEVEALFATKVQALESSSSNGANCQAFAGTVNLNCQNINLTEDTLINCTCVFGTVNISLPQNTRVKIKQTALFGEVKKHKKTGTNPDKNAPTLYINATCLFGGVNIK